MAVGLTIPDSELTPRRRALRGVLANLLDLEQQIDSIRVMVGELLEDEPRDVEEKA